MKTPRAGLNFTALMAQARTGDRAAVQALFARYLPRLQRWAEQRARAGAPISPSELCQRTGLRAYERLPRFRGHSEGEWVKWLMRVLRSQWVRALRVARTQKRGAPTVPLDEEALAQPSSEASPTRLLSGKERGKRLLQLLARLPGDQGMAVIRRHVEGYSVAELATQLNRSPSEVSSLIWRGLQGLRERLGGRSIDEMADAPQLDQAMGEYLKLVDEGRPVDREAFLRRWSECGADLRDLLDLDARLSLCAEPACGER